MGWGLNYVIMLLQWSGVVVQWYAEIAGLKFKVENASRIRKHFEVRYIILYI